MIKLLYTFLAVSIILSACEKEKEKSVNSPFTGYWSGKYYEEDSTTQIGIWNGNISSSGEITGNVLSAETGTVALIGAVTNSGIFDASIGSGDSVVTFYGQLNTHYFGSGEWSSLINDSKGFWEVDTLLALGDTYEGGIIFYLDGNGGGLIAAPTDQSTGDEWATAVDICANLTLGGYSDWFLPSKDELNEMYLTLRIQGLGGLEGARYWSSTEYDSHNAWIQVFYDTSSNGFQHQAEKGILHSVRAIRYF